MTSTQTKIIAIAGAGMHGGVWRSLIAHLPGVEVACLDLPGHRDSQPFLPTIQDMAAYVTSNLGGNPVILMGHSMGALAALAAAAHSSVKAVILMGAAASMPVHPDLLRQAHETPAAAGDMILKWGISNACADIDSVRAALKQIMQETAPAALGNDLAACQAFIAGADLAKNMAKPALVIAGEHDKMTRAADGEALSRLFPYGQFSLLPATGHMMMAERPTDVAGIVAAFVKTVG